MIAVEAGAADTTSVTGTVIVWLLPLIVIDAV